MNNYQLALKDVAYRLHLREGLKEENYQGDESLVKLQELVNKETPKKPIRICLNRYEFDDCEVDVCPNCKNTEQTIVSDDGSGQKFKRCHECGQAIDWSSNE